MVKVKPRTAVSVPGLASVDEGLFTLIKAISLISVNRP